MAEPAASAPGATEASALPSGMDLLYGDRVGFLPHGEPVVAIGLMTGRPRVTVRGEGGLRLDFYEAGLLKQASVRPGEAVVMTMGRATPARRSFYLDLGGSPFGDAAALESALASWRARGYAEVSALEQGLVFGVGGRVLDNREVRIILPAASARAADRAAAALFEAFGTRATVKTKLAERPWGELRVQAGGAPLGLATSYVRITSQSPAPIQVSEIEYGRGYAWHGFEDRRYDGEIYVVVDPEGTLAVVNVLGVERVLAGVVPAEMFASAPPEALKAQAVAARNHLLSKLGRRHQDDPFDLCAEQHCQVYAGINREDPRATAAVSATYGEALFRGSTLVESVYSSSCGGHTEDNDAVWGDAADPALRGRPDFDVKGHPELAAFANGITGELIDAWVAARPETFCSKASSARPERFRWARTFSGAELSELLSHNYAEIGKLRDIVVEERGVGGRVVSLRLIGTSASARVVHELPIRQLFQNLNSGAFTVEVKHGGDGLVTEATFRGAGWGHGAGMCQLGAIGRAEAGHDYRRILAHYYNGATVQALYGVPTAASAPPERQYPTAANVSSTANVSTNAGAGATTDTGVGTTIPAPTPAPAP